MSILGNLPRGRFYLLTPAAFTLFILDTIGSSGVHLLLCGCLNFPTCHIAILTRSPVGRDRSPVRGRDRDYDDPRIAERWPPAPTSCTPISQGGRHPGQEEERPGPPERRGPHHGWKVTKEKITCKPTNSVDHL